MDEITFEELYNGIIPAGWNKLEIKPLVTGFYDTLCIVGSVNAKVMTLTKMFKVYDYTDDNGYPVGRWMEGDWIQVKAWKERDR